uniref:Matrix protein n=1 Tax=avian paramyxovirus 8 TaxID=2560318 RepID=C3TWQ4_9MONO|nr:matrix protein [Avian metaavulavirus 8]AFX97640.1 matrix protein [Avian metaavulavirus 8]
MAYTTLKLWVDEGDMSSSLLSFPLVLKETDRGTKKLQPQVRVDSIGDVQNAKESSIFVTLYGFIQAIKENSDRSKFFHPKDDFKPETVTAGLVVVGAIRMMADVNTISNDALALEITVKKSATSQEKMTVMFHNSPPSLRTAITIRAGGFISNADENIKCASKLTAGVQYIFRPMFVSITKLHNGKLYRVPKSIHSISSTLLYSVMLEVGFKVDIGKDHPQAKMLKRVTIGDADTYWGFAWFHLCNFKKTSSKGKPRTLDELKTKVKNMGLKLELHDLWGPTIVVQITGKSSKYAQGFFSSNGTCCLPISRSAPELGKLLWSCSATIGDATVVIQSSEKGELLRSDDLEIRGAVASKKGRLSSFHPFKK